MNIEEIPFTAGQQEAHIALPAFLMDPNEPVFLVSGYAGTGKSTLIQRFLHDLPSTLNTQELITKDNKKWDIVLTATTNKAAEVFSTITNKEVRTIQSFLGLRVDKNYTTGETRLVPTDPDKIISNTIIIIDEASFFDTNLMKWLFKMTVDCKIIFIGDPGQLTAVKSTNLPVFVAGFPEVTLTEVVRAGSSSQIIDLATAFRETVNNGQFFSFIPNKKDVEHLPREEFEAKIIETFKNPDVKHDDAKVLAWTNARVISYNKGIREVIEGIPELQVGDYAVCNNFISNKRCKVKTDQTVRITGITPTTQRNTRGWDVVMDNCDRAFLPVSIAARKRAIKEAKDNEDYAGVGKIDMEWIDLRAAYACTINKSQGSTYKTVFIDLDDVKKCRNKNQLARMMYVAVSRASEKVYLTGDLF